MPANPRGVYAITKTERVRLVVAEACRKRPGVPIAVLFVDALDAEVVRWREPDPVPPRTEPKLIGGGCHACMEIKARGQGANGIPHTCGRRTKGARR